MTALVSEVIVPGATALVWGFFVPWIGMRLIASLLSARAPRVVNYHGAILPTGLGAVWVFWVAGAWLVRSLPFADLPTEVSGTAWPTTALLIVVALGFADDRWGDSDARGIRGHLRALFGGRITTGIVKLVGVVLASGWAAWVALETGWASSWGIVEVDARSSAGAWIAATVLIAGSANLVNLLDLRPGRAIKGYAVLAATAVGSFVICGGHQGIANTLGAPVALTILLLGPVAAVCRSDLREAAVLGDAGANAMGFVAGYSLARYLPPAGIVTAAVIVVGLNLLSEQVSFSEVIENHRSLKRLDLLGRLPLDGPTGMSGAASSDETPQKPDER